MFQFQISRPSWYQFNLFIDNQVSNEIANPSWPMFIQLQIDWVNTPPSSIFAIYSAIDTLSYTEAKCCGGVHMII